MEIDIGFSGKRRTKCQWEKTFENDRERESRKKKKIIILGDKWEENKI